MNTVKIEKGRLKAALEKNKETHAAEYGEAIDSYEKSVQEWFEEQLVALKAGRQYQLMYSDQQKPQDHTQDYDDALEILDFTEDDVITLSRQEFQQYILDRWNWQQEFKTTATYYNTKVGKEF